MFWKRSKKGGGRPDKGVEDHRGSKPNEDPEADAKDPNLAGGETLEPRILYSGTWVEGTTGDDTMTGTADHDHLDGLAGNDTLSGAGGDDVLRGGDGDDLIDGGAGLDTVDFLAAGSGVTVDITSTDPQVTGGAGTDTLTSIEGVIGSTFDDTFSFANPVDGSTYTVDGSSGANDTVDLRSYNSSAITYGDGSLTVDMGSGQSFTLNYLNVDALAFSDVTIPAPITPEGHWAFDADASDSSGNSYDGTLTNQAAIDTTSATDIVGGGKLSLDGTDDTVDLSAHVGAFSGLTQGTISGWVNTTDASASSQTVFGVSDTSSGSDYAFFGVRNGQIHFEIASTTSGVIYSVASTASVLNDGAWHHIAMTVDAAGNTLYVDGVAVPTGDLSYIVGSATNTEFFADIPALDAMNIGALDRLGSLALDYNGLIDDVQVYSTALSAAHVADLATVVAETAVSATNDSLTTAEDTPLVFDPTANDLDSNSDAISVVEFSQPANGSVVDNGDGTLTYTPDADYSGSDSFDYVAIDTGTGLQNYWGLDGDATDSVGGEHGTVYGADTVPGDLGNGLSFNETTDYALLPDVTYNSEFTVSFAFKIDEINGSLFQYLYSHGDINATNSVNIFLNEDAHGTDPNVLRTVVRDGDDTLDNSALQIDISSLVGDGQFHTYTLTVGVNGLEVFIDGASAATDATRGTGGVNPTGGVYLGARQDLNADRRFGGELDSVQIYDNALAATQVADLSEKTNQGTVDITVTVAMTPTNVIPNAQTTSEDTTLVFNAANGNLVSIADDAGDVLTVTLSVANGTITLSQTTGLAFTAGDGLEDGTVSFTGTIEDVNAALDGLQYTPGQDFNGSDSLTLQSAESAVISFDSDANLVGYYEFASPAPGSDSSPGGANSATLQGDATIITDAALGGDTLSLDGSGGFAQVSGEFGQPADITLAAWVNGTNSYADVFSIQNRLMLRFDDPNQGGFVNAIYHDGTTYRHTTSTVALEDTGWHHIALTFDDASKTMTLYIDGTQAAQNSFTDSISYLGGDTFIGSGTGGLHFQGQIDDARVFDRALDGSDISALAASPVYETDSDTLAINVDPSNDAPTFGVADGIVTTDIAGPGDVGQSVTIQPDGKLLSGGYSHNGTSYEFALTRYNSDGSLDLSFGVDGIATTDVGVSTDAGYDVALQADGKILVTGFTDSGTSDDFVLIRYNADGTLDTSFDGDGIVTTDLSTTGDVAESVVVQADGKILVAGSAFNGTDYDFALVRYNADGSLDTSFAGDGIATTDLGSGADRGRSVTVQSDGKILVAGKGIATDADFAIVRYNSDGSLDTSFGGDGITTTDVGGGADAGFSVTVQPDGKILVAGRSYDGSSDAFALTRYNSDGSLDTSFDNDGIVTTDIGVGTDIAYSVDLQPDGKILATGYSNNGVSTEIALIRYNSDGSLDTTFGGSGIVTTDLGPGNDSAYDAALQSDGKIVVAGYSDNGPSVDFAILRYNADGSLDTTFDSGLLNATPTFVEGGSAIVLDADVTMFDTELSALDDFAGSTLTLARNGGANTEDAFSATGNLAALAEGGQHGVVRGHDRHGDHQQCGHAGPVVQQQRHAGTCRRDPAGDRLRQQLGYATGIGTDRLGLRRRKHGFAGHRRRADCHGQHNGGYHAGNRSARQHRARRTGGVRRRDSQH